MHALAHLKHWKSYGLDGILLIALKNLAWPNVLNSVYQLLPSLLARKLLTFTVSRRAHRFNPGTHW